jgi:hypothetical protein
MDWPQGAVLPATAWRPWSARSRAEVAFLLGEQQAAERVSRRLFGRVLAPHEYAGLAGAPDDAQVEVGASDGKLYIAIGDRMTGAYRGYYYLYGGKTGVTLLNDGFRIQVWAVRRKGLGLQIFHRQSRNAAALGVGRIEIVAGRGRDENGYYTWPRYGFQARLPPPILRLLPVELKDSQTVLDVMASEQGRTWWAEHGATIAVRFALSSGSRSQRTLADYVRKRIIGEDYNRSGDETHLVR